ncbi:MAG: ribose 5-phosphate isomerase B [Chloroflexi bacterium]|nr:ribose 5-phosphate isomerase B [Chloroflexota bacterium]
MRISLTADHNGFELKKELIEHIEFLGHEAIDLGPYEYESTDDYPDYAKIISDNVSKHETDRGIMICGSGVGASVAANKIKGTRAAVCHDIYSAHQGVEHDDMNLLCIGSKIIGVEIAKELVKAFIDAKYTGEERHSRRLNKVLNMENEFNQKEHLSTLKKREDELYEEIEQLKTLNNKKIFQNRAVIFLGISILIVLLWILANSIIQ